MLADLAPCVVDIGARGGLDEEMLALSWATHVVGFEPEAEEAARLAELGDRRWRAVTILPYAVAAQEGPAVLYMPESKEGASLLRHNPAMLSQFGYDNLHRVRDEIPIDAVTLDALRAAGQLPRTDFMKIDVEGAELEVLRSGRSVLDDLVAIKVECSFLPQRLDQALIWDVASFLVGEGFSIMDWLDVRRWRRRNLPGHPYRIAFDMPYSRGQLAQCDLIALKSPDALTSVDQSLRLVVLSATLGFFDYAVGVLRARPEVQKIAREEWGLDLEGELKVWSGQCGRQEVRRAIRTTLRSLVPLARSLLGRLPYAKPGQPY